MQCLVKHMSRIGNTPVAIPQGVTVTVQDGFVMVKGPKGELREQLQPRIEVSVADDIVHVARKGEDKQTKSLHGLVRSLINNLVIGVTQGYEKRLEMVGTGYRAVLQGTTLVLSVGFSHSVEVVQPQGIMFIVEGNNKITVKGISKHDVGQVAANIRKIKPPEPYKGKGIKYENEVVRRKAGKAVKAASATPAA